MKRITYFSLLPLLAIVIFVAAQNTYLAPVPQEEVASEWPEDVTEMLEASCNDCHSKDASNVKAKGALNFTKWEDYKLTKKIGKLNDISEVVKGKKMPPKKFLEKFPDKALSDDQIVVITNWANAEAEKLMEE